MYGRGALGFGGSGGGCDGAGDAAARSGDAVAWAFEAAVLEGMGTVDGAVESEFVTGIVTRVDARLAPKKTNHAAPMISAAIRRRMAPSRPLIANWKLKIENFSIGMKFRETLVVRNWRPERRHWLIRPVYLGSCGLNKAQIG